MRRQVRRAATSLGLVVDGLFVLPHVHVGTEMLFEQEPGKSSVDMNDIIVGPYFTL